MRGHEPGDTTPRYRERQTCSHCGKKSHSFVEVACFKNCAQEFREVLCIECYPKYVLSMASAYEAKLSSALNRYGVDSKVTYGSANIKSPPPRRKASFCTACMKLQKGTPTVCRKCGRSGSLKVIEAQSELTAILTTMKGGKFAGMT